MKQPELGRKIAELRKAKSLTQEELAEKCRLNVRTIQRMESGMVTPRSYTLKAIYAALEFTMNNSSESDVKRRVPSFIQDKTGQIYKYIIELFNLKTDTMKKLSILSATTLVFSFSFLALCSESKAQKVKENKYITSNGRGIVYQFPKDRSIQISNMKDTAYYQLGEDQVQEYKYQIFLNKKWTGQAHLGDTVILDQGRIEIRRPYFVEFRSFNKKGIIYCLPKFAHINYAANRDTDAIVIEGSKILEYDNKIFLNGKYIGSANTGDSVIFKRESFHSKSSISIKKGN
ncbi:MAG TPA: helix-turn-helix transcriptional regulator [Prolixibacteraceae bacterium]|nr:helix-turn-helix transcriptional regulator [Prolixibacteraceae bacterium]